MEIEQINGRSFCQLLHRKPTQINLLYIVYLNKFQVRDNEKNSS